MIVGAIVALGLFRAGPYEPSPSARELLPWTFTDVDEICSHEIKNRLLFDDDNSEYTAQRKQWNMFVDGVDLIAEALQENSLVCVQGLGSTTEKVALDVCVERANQSDEVKGSPLRSIGEALRAKYPGQCPRSATRSSEAPP